MISESNLSLQLGRSVYPHNSQSTLFSGLFDEKKDHPQCRTQKIPIGHQSTFSNSICSPSGSRSRSTSSPRSPPLSSLPYLPHLLSLEVNQTKNKDLHRSKVKIKVIAKTLDPYLNHPSPTNTMQIKNREYDQASNDEVCSDDNNSADSRQYTYEKNKARLD